MVTENLYRFFLIEQIKGPKHSRALFCASWAREKLKVLGLVIVAALSLMLPAPINAEQGTPDYLIDTKVIKAEVTAVDLESRLLTFRGPNQMPVEVHVSEKIKNLNKIKIGDQIKIEYHASVAIYLGEPGSRPKEDVDLVVERSGKGDSPGGRALETLDASALVKSIDYANRTMTLELYGGSVVTIEVDQSLKEFNSFKVGDTIQVRLTKAVAFSLETPEP